jgi:hypothetical protein
MVFAIGLSPSCVRSVTNGHSRRSSRVLASIDLANMTHVRPPKSRHSGCNESARKLLPGRFAWFLPDRNLAKYGAGPAGHRPPTARWQDKRRKVRPGRRAEEGRNISILQRGAFSARSVRFSAIPCKITDSRTSHAETACRQEPVCRGCAVTPDTPSHDRLACRCRTAAAPSRLALCATGSAASRP